MALVTAPLGRRDNFPYRRLGYQEIRLVVVKKHAHRPRENTLTCSIQHMILDIGTDNSASSTPYTALSYTWGDGKDVTSVKLLDETTGKSGDITVTSNLISALQTILEPGKRHTLWIDQICINQSSTEEKGQQVQLMRWIYERAASVRVWLGPAAEDSDEAMMYLENNDRASLVRDLSDPNQARFTPRLGKALERLFRRPYWSRTWTVQEATALRSLQAVISCGHRSVYLERIFEWAYAGYTNLNKVSDRIAWLQGDGIRTMQGFWYLRRDYVQALHVLVGRARILMASDPRDKVYSMLNFATDVDGSGIKPDYTKTVRQTYTELVLWSIGKYQCLDILGDCHPSLKEDAAPSWVPDWGECTWESPFVRTCNPDDPGSSSLYRASGDYVRDLIVRNPVDVNTRLLLLSGIRVANLAVISNRVPTKSRTWAVQETWEPTDGDTICPLTMKPMHEVFRRTIYLDVLEIRTRDFSRGNDFPLPWDTKGSAESSQHANATRYPRAMGFGRCPFYTTPGLGSTQGLLGFSFLTARPGDELWILKGGKMPFILRPKALTMPLTDLETGEAFELPVDAGMPTYELVGEAFVLGLMDGEIIDMLGETPKRERPPPLADMDREFKTIGLI